MQIAIVLYPGMTALDAIGPYEVLRMMPGADVRFVWHETGPVVVDSGLLALSASHTLEETPAPDVVLVPGATTVVSTMAHRELLAWLAKVHETTTWTTSVCTGSTLLGAAGLLDGREATTHWMSQPALRALGAKPQRDQRIVRSGKIVTAAGVAAGIDLGLWLVGEIAGAEQAQMIQLMIEYDPQPPFDAGHPSKVSPALRRKTMAQMVRQGASVRETITTPRVVWDQAIRRIRSRSGQRK